MNNYKIKIIDNIESLQIIEKEWNELFSKCADASIFSSYIYNYTAWKNLRDKNDHLFIILFYQNDTIQAIAPFCITRQKIHGIPVRRIDFIAVWEGDKPSIVAPDNEEVIWDEISLFLKNEFHAWDVLNVMEQPLGSFVLTKSNFLSDKKFFFQMIHDSTTYFIDINCKWDDYISIISKSQNRKLNKYIKRLKQEHGDFTFEIITDHERIDEAINRFVALEKSSWKGEQSIGVHQDSSTISFIYRKAQVLDCDYATDGKARFTLRIRKDDLERLKGLISSSS